jgi:hypothetical protein
MMTFFGSRERNLEEWRDLVRRVDPRLTMKAISLNPGDLIDIQWAE